MGKIVFDMIDAFSGQKLPTHTPSSVNPSPLFPVNITETMVQAKTFTASYMLEKLGIYTSVPVLHTFCSSGKANMPM